MRHFLCLSFAALAFLTAPTPAIAEDTSVHERVTTSGTLRRAYGISPPNLVKDPNTGKLSGLDVDVWEEIGKELGLKIEWAEEAGWGNFIEGLKTGRYDAFCSMLWPDPGRSKFATLTIPVMYSSLQTYVRADDHRFDGNLEKINSSDVIIPAVEGDVSVSMAQNRFPQAKLLMLPQTATLSEMFISVTTKKADVMFLDHAMFEALDKENKGALRELEKVPDSFVFASYYAVKSGEFALRDSLNIALQTMIDNGRIETLAHKYSPNYKAPKKNF